MEPSSSAGCTDPPVINRGLVEAFYLPSLSGLVASDKRAETLAGPTSSARQRRCDGSRRRRKRGVDRDAFDRIAAQGSALEVRAGDCMPIRMGAGHPAGVTHKSTGLGAFRRPMTVTSATSWAMGLAPWSAGAHP